MQRVGGGGLVVLNEIGERKIFIVELEYNGAGAWSRGYANCHPHWTRTVGGLIKPPPVIYLILNSSINL